MKTKLQELQLASIKKATELSNTELKRGDIVVAWDDGYNMPKIAVFDEMDGGGKFVCSNCLDARNPDCILYHYDYAVVYNGTFPDYFKDKIKG